MLDNLRNDLRDALRALRKRPGFSAVVILTLALGIGANTAIFSVVNRVLLQPLDFPDSQQLYLVHEIVPQWVKSYPLLEVNFPAYLNWRENVHSFDALAITQNTSMTLTGAGEPEQISGIRASASLLGVLGTRPAIGRPFTPAEDETGHGLVVILTDNFWRQHFQADPGILGRSITLDGASYSVAGVLPRDFHFPGAVNGLSQSAQFIVPLNGQKWYEQGLIGDFDFAAIARLKNGVPPQQAVAELNVVQAAIAKAAGGPLELRAAMVPLQNEVVGGARSGLLLLLAGVAAVLVMICVNVANLLLTRVPGRMREAGIRKALGATDSRLLQHSLIENLLLGLLGGGLGVLLAGISSQWISQLAPLHLPRMSEIRVDGWALAFALLVSIFTAVLFGSLPALLLSRASVNETLVSSGKGATRSRRSRRVQGSLVVLQVATCTLLLVTAGLLGRSVLRLLDQDPGFNVDQVLAADVFLPSATYPQPAARETFYRRVLEELRALPGARSVAWVHILPLEGGGSHSGINLLGEQRLPAEQQPAADFRAISPEYFQAMGIPLLRGRLFNEQDRGKPRLIISQSLAQRLWPGKDPIGQQCMAFWGGLQKQPSEVIGVVGDIRQRLDRPPVNIVYVPDSYGQPTPGVPSSAAFVIRSDGNPSSLAPSVYHVIRSAGPDVPIIALQPMSTLVARNVEDRRFQMLLTVVFALSALVLAALGIFGVVAYSVEQRRREFGIRTALGAQPADLLRMVMRQGMAPVLLGLGAGVVASLAGGSLLQSFVFGLSPRDSLTLAGVSVLVALVAAVACFVPARHGMRADPMVALRYE
jgi:predicted permease